MWTRTLNRPKGWLHSSGRRRRPEMKPDGEQYSGNRDGGGSGFHFQDRTAGGPAEDHKDHLEVEEPKVTTGPLTFDIEGLREEEGFSIQQGSMDAVEAETAPAVSSHLIGMAGLKAKAELTRMASAVEDDGGAGVLAKALAEAASGGFGSPGGAGVEDPGGPGEPDPQESVGGGGEFEVLKPVAVGPGGPTATLAPVVANEGGDSGSIEAPGDAPVVQWAPAPRKQAPTPRVQALEVHGLSLEPVIHEDPKDSKHERIQKSARDMTLILAGLIGVPPKGARNPFETGLQAPGAGGVKPVSWSPESARVEMPHNSADRLPAHNDDAPVAVVKKPEIEPNLLDSRLDEADVDAMLGGLDEDPEGADGPSAALGSPPVVTPVPPELLPTPRNLAKPPAAPIAPVGGLLAPLPSPSLPTPQPGAPPQRREGPSAPPPKAVSKGAEKAPMSGPSWSDLVLGSAVAIGVAVGLASVVGRGSDGDGMRRMAFSDRRAIQVYLDDHLAQIERRLTEVEGEINSRARATDIKPQDIGRMEGLARERAGLALLREAVLARRHLLGVEETKGKEDGHE
jgi:hypothetical protein